MHHDIHIDFFLGVYSVFQYFFQLFQVDYINLLLSGDPFVMSKGDGMQTVPEALSQPLYYQFLLRPSFTFHLSSSIQRILDPYSHSTDRIDTQDIFILIDQQEIMRKFIDYNDAAFRLFIQMTGQHYEKSPSELKGELPLMVLTQTESIFLRRIKRFKKLQKEEYSSDGSSSTSSFISFSKSYMGKSSCKYIQSRISQKDISQLSQFKSSSLESDSFHNAFQPEFSSNQSQLLLLRKKAAENFNEKLLQSGIKRQSTRPEQRDELMIQAIKSPQQEELEHLIMGQISGLQQPQQNRKQSDYSIRLPSLAPRTRYVSFQNWNSGLPPQIKQRVERQLYKYKVIDLLKLDESSSSVAVSTNCKKMKQKAQQLLFSIQNLR